MCEFRGPVVVYLLLLFVATEGSNLKQLAVDIGRNLTILCPIHRTRDVAWIKETPGSQQRHMNVLENGSLFITTADRNDSGIYACSRKNDVDSDVKAKFNVTVRTPPPPLVNVVVIPSTILALITWKYNANDGGYPIINCTAEYRLAYTNSSWMPISPNHIPPNSHQIEVYKLQPNTTYQFRIWATNQLGKGVITEVYGTTLDIYEEQKLARHLLDGADKFDTRIWAAAVGIVMGTLILLGLGTCFLLYQECRISGDIKTQEYLKILKTTVKKIPTIDIILVSEEQEVIELVPNIILNPGFDPSNHNDQVPDENSNSETPMRLNNNTVVQPRNP